MQSLAGQLADMVTCWRRDIPLQQHCGNVQGVQTGHAPVVDVSALEIRGILSKGIDSAAPIADANEAEGARILRHLRLNFPLADEFLNDHVAKNGDWPRAFYGAYLARLELNGVATPLRTLDRGAWNRSCWLETLVARIAPWELPGDRGGAELEYELARAADVVLCMLGKLGGLTQQGISPAVRRRPV